MVCLFLTIAVLCIAAAMYNPGYLIGTGLALTTLVWLGCLKFYWIILAWRASC